MYYDRYMLLKLLACRIKDVTEDFKWHNFFLFRWPILCCEVDIHVVVDRFVHMRLWFSTRLSQEKSEGSAKPYKKRKNRTVCFNKSYRPKGSLRSVHGPPHYVCRSKPHKGKLKMLQRFIYKRRRCIEETTRKRTFDFRNHADRML